MKTINFKVLLVLFILATVGCSKELSNESIDETASDVNLEATHVPNSKMDYGSFEVKNGIIYFEDTKDLVNTLKALANNVEFDIINYQNKIDKNLSEEEVLAFLDVEKWDENQTFIDFENEHNFQSLRPIYEEKLTLWGEAGLIESDVNNPANCLPFESLPVLTVLNQDAILGVGNKLYKFLNNGVIYEIVDGNINTAAQINENQGRILAITQFENKSLLEDNLRNALEEIKKNGVPVLMPIHVHGNHWVGAIIRKQTDGNLQIIYNDPKGNSIQNEGNVDLFIKIIQNRHKSF